MTDYTQPLADPVLEAAAQMAVAGSEFRNATNARLVALTSCQDARNLVAEAARQIDHLRSIGAIPPAEPPRKETN